MRDILIFLFMIMASGASAESCSDYGLVLQEPWVAYGGVNLNASQQVANPPTATNGIRGEVTALPYIVPDKKVLFLESVTLESLWGVDLVPSIGPVSASPITVLGTYTAGPLVYENPWWINRSPTMQFHARFQIPATSPLHVLFRAAAGWPTSGGPWMVQWSMHGFLCFAP